MTGREALSPFSSPSASSPADSPPSPKGIHSKARGSGARRYPGTIPPQHPLPQRGFVRASRSTIHASPPANPCDQRSCCPFASHTTTNNLTPDLKYQINHPDEMPECSRGSSEAIPPDPSGPHDHEEIPCQIKRKPIPSEKQAPRISLHGVLRIENVGAEMRSR